MTAHHVPGVLSIKPFRRLWIALSLSSLGDWLSIVALTALAANLSHGGNVGLKENPSNYQVSILEVAGSLLTRDEIVRLEELWKVKLKSKEMGLNR